MTAPPVPLLVDFYEITMASGYWQAGVSEHEAAFHVAFRTSPFEGELAVACGLASVVDFLRNFRVPDDVVAHLAGQRGNDGKDLFDPAFLDHLRSLRLTCDIDAAPEGTLVFPQEPLLRVCGPLLQCQLLETALLNLLNFQTLIATKAARVCLAAGEDRVLEFGLRRAQGPDGGMSASRAAYIGGCAATSNVLAGARHRIPMSGTQAHSWIMFFDDEREAFVTYARALPNNGVFLVDTYDTLQGVRHAIEAGRLLRASGHEPIGIRLDSGDCAALSIEARRMLDEAGFPDALIVCSGDLDEWAITGLKRRGARIDVWGVGTRLVTASGQGALDGVYKLSAVRAPGGAWRPRIKLSEERAKTSSPGVQQVRRYRRADGRFGADVIFDPEHGEPSVGIDLQTGDRMEWDAPAVWEDLLVPVFRRGELVYREPSLQESRDRARGQLECAPPEVARLERPQRYPVGLEQSLHELRESLIERGSQK